MSGPESVKIDPFELWRKLYEMGEEGLKSAGVGAGAGLGAGAPNAKSVKDASAKVIEMLVALQKSSQEAAARAPESLNLPTRDDLARLTDIVASIGEKIERLDARLAALEKGSRTSGTGARAAKKGRS